MRPKPRGSARLSDTGPPTSEAGPSTAQNASSEPSGPEPSPRGGRALRTRPSEPAAPRRAARASSGRVITADEETRALFKLGPEGTAQRRIELLHELETSVRSVVDKHDMAVREKFHLERYVSILEGWDPAAAKVDNSAVFLEVRYIEMTS